MEKPKGTKKHEQESQQEGVSITRVQNKVGDNQKNIKDTEALNKVKVEEESNVMFNPEEQDGSGLNEEKTFERQSETESNKREDLNSKNFSAECVTSGNKNESSKNLESNDALSHASKIGEKTEENSGSKVEEVILQESVPKKRVASQKETVKKLELDEVGDVENEETGEQVLKYIIKFCTDLFSSNTKTAENGETLDQVQKNMFTQETLHNLFAVFFGAVAFYAVITNYLENGSVLRLPHYFASGKAGNMYILNALIVVFCIPMFHFINLGIEKMLLYEKFTEKVATIAYLCNISTMLTFPIAFFRYIDETNILYRLTLLTLYVYTYMKSSSFWSWNHNERIKWQREKAKAGTDPVNKLPEKNGKIVYPDNLNFWSVLRFSVVPCYCYKPDYPRRPPSVQRILKIVAVCYAQAEVSVNLVDHILQPVQQQMFVEDHGFYNWKSYRQFVDEMRIVILLSPIFGLASILFLNALLYGILNLLAEISSFDHDGFCGDWWNAEDIKGYWNTWNYPVHDYLRDHVYIPCRRRGFSNFESNMVAFFLSGVFHDYAMGGVMGIYTLWATSSMSIQALNIEICEAIRKRFGNYGRRFTNLLVVQAWPLGATATFTYLFKLKTEGQ